MTMWKDVYPQPGTDFAILEVRAKMGTDKLFTTVSMPPFLIGTGQVLRIRIEDGRVIYEMEVMP